jgi:hypothetical protein
MLTQWLLKLLRIIFLKISLFVDIDLLIFLTEYLFLDVFLLPLVDVEDGGIEFIDLFFLFIDSFETIEDILNVVV